MNASCLSNLATEEEQGKDRRLARSEQGAMAALRVINAPPHGREPKPR
jgi:hypothetical protein